MIYMTNFKARLALLGFFALALCLGSGTSPRAIDYQQYTIVKLTDGNVTAAHRFEISCTRQEGSTVINNFTGAGKITFAFKCTNVNLTDPEKRQLVDMISTFLVEAKADGG